MRFAGFIAIGLAGVAALAAARPTPAPRDAAREVLKARGCGSCHDSAVSTEHANALAVYDLHGHTLVEGWQPSDLRAAIEGQATNLASRGWNAPYDFHRRSSPTP